MFFFNFDFFFNDLGLISFNYLGNLYILLIFFILSILLSSSLFFISFILGTSVVILDNEKLSAYECGFSPIAESRSLIDLKFYKTAILFLIFDIEIIFLFPWSVVLLNNSFINLNYLKMSLPFLIALFLGVIIEYKDRLYNW